MRLPRVRFTVRTMMVAVAVVALALVFVIPASVRLFWLYNTPSSVKLFTAGVDYRPIRSTSQGPFTVGQAVPAQCSYKCKALPVIPTGLIYRASVVANLMDPKSWKTLESHRETHFLISGIGSWKGIQGKFSCGLTPRRPGRYMVQYEVNVTDLFGRRDRAALNTDAFQAR